MAPSLNFSRAKVEWYFKSRPVQMKDLQVLNVKNKSRKTTARSFQHYWLRLSYCVKDHNTASWLLIANFSSVFCWNPSLYYYVNEIIADSCNLICWAQEEQENTLLLLHFAHAAKISPNIQIKWPLWRHLSKSIMRALRVSLFKFYWQLDVAPQPNTLHSFFVFPWRVTVRHVSFCHDFIQLTKMNPTHNELLINTHIALHLPPTSMWGRVPGIMHQNEQDICTEQVKLYGPVAADLWLQQSFFLLLWLVSQFLPFEER
jgi:hypothetical protein